jgi:hypothetical protein
MTTSLFTQLQNRIAAGRAALAELEPDQPPVGARIWMLCDQTLTSLCVAPPEMPALQFWLPKHRIQYILRNEGIVWLTVSDDLAEEMGLPS